MVNLRKHRDIKIFTTENRRNNLASEPNYHITKFFTENLLAIEIKKTQITMNKPVYLGLSILDLSKIVMYEFWYDYIKPKYGENTKLFYMVTGSFIVHVKTEDVILQKMLKQDLTLQIMKQTYCCLKEKIKE